MKKIVVFTGAGVSAESGIATFRDSNGLWANYRIEDVCTPEALKNNRNQVIEFYNIRRKELLTKSPNNGHIAIAELSKYFNTEIITQNIDDLHERAAIETGISPTNILHLHGELRKLRSSIDEEAIVNFDGWEQKLDTKHNDGSLLRPFVVFFGESVPMFEKAIEIASKADILIIAGTSLAVYPAASIIHYIRENVPIYVIDPGEPAINGIRNKVTHIKNSSAIGLPMLIEELKNQL